MSMIKMSVDRCALVAKPTLLSLAIGSILAGSSPALADILNFRITIDGIQELPLVDTTGAGSGTATLDTDTNLFTWDMTFADLTGTQTAAHFHAPAGRCESAPPVITLPLGSPIQGSQTVSAQQAQEIMDGLWYVNIHTNLFPGGEIRGQVEPEGIDNPFFDFIELGDIELRLPTVATGMVAPNWGTAPAGDSEHLFVVDQPGTIWRVALDDGSVSVFLDVSDRLVELGIEGPDSFDERGLLGAAFAPDYFTSGLVYTYTSEPANAPADFSTIPDGLSADHQSVIIEWTVPNPTDADAVVDPNSARVLMRIDQPQFNHDGGCINFGPDGMLYIALGDGGGADDTDGQDGFEGPMIGHGCEGNGQDLNTILGSLARIDPTGSNSVNGQYGIPADNPFVGKSGLDEIYAYGLRNPFRFSFDSETGTLLLGDVGQNFVEEVNIIVSGGNYGWNIKEGSFRFVPNGRDFGYVASPANGIFDKVIDPIVEYDHDDGLSVIGGFVYRGSAIPELQGRYVFAEFGRFFNNDGRLLYIQGGQIREFIIRNQFDVGMFVLGLGQDDSGELYVLGNATGVPFGDTGVVQRVTPSLQLDVTGNCPGRLTVTASGLAANANVAIALAFGPGSTLIPFGPCAGTSLDLNATVRLGAGPIPDANGDGIVSFQSRPVPSVACGGAVLIQAIDLSNCETSDVVATP